MTLRTTSATRRTVVSRSSDVARTSATSSRSDSTGRRSGLERTEPIPVNDSSRSSRISAGSKIPTSRKRTRDPSPSLRAGSALLGLFSGHDANVGEVAVFFRVVKAVADYEFVGNFEAHVIALERKLAP